MRSRRILKITTEHTTSNQYKENKKRMWTTDPRARKVKNKKSMPGKSPCK